MLPTWACYEERFRLTSDAIYGLTAATISIAAGVIWSRFELSAASIILAVPAFLAGAATVLAVPEVLAVARRVTALRADVLGLTLGARPDNLPALRGPAVFVPWSDVEQIVVYLEGRGKREDAVKVTRIAVQRKEVPAWTLPDQAQEADRVVLSATTMAAGSLTRKICGWRLNRHRFANICSTLAPEVQVVEIYGSGFVSGE